MLTRVNALVLASAVLLGGVSPALAAPADPDVSFGSGGFVTGNFSDRSGSARVQALVQQPDGKFVAAGAADNGTSRDFALARFNTDGTLDTTFGASGVVLTGIGGRDDFGQAVALHADGRIVVAGYVQEDFVAGASRTAPVAATEQPRGAPRTQSE